MEKTSTTIKEYIQSLPVENRDDIQALHNAIVKVIPKASVTMWEGVFWGGSQQKIIGYGDLSYIRSDKKEVKWFKIGLALQKNYISVFVVAVDGKQYLAEKYKKELGKVKVGRSSISFKRLEDIKLDKLMEIVKKGYELMEKNTLK